MIALPPFGEIQPAEVRAFVINADITHPSHNLGVVMDGALNPNRTPDQGILLSTAQVHQLHTSVTIEHPQLGVAACFYPHHGFVFYDSEGQILGHLSICFMCFTKNAHPPFAAISIDFAALKSLVEELGLPLSFP